MKQNNENLSTKFHKTGFRKIIRDERLHPRVRLLAQFFLAYMEGVFPKELLNSVIESEYGLRRLNKPTSDESGLEETIDKNTAKLLEKQWDEIIKGGNNDSGDSNDRSTTNATTTTRAASTGTPVNDGPNASER